MHVISALKRLIFPILLPALLVGSCVPGEIDGTVLAEEWTEYECRCAVIIPSGDVVVVRFQLAEKNRSGYDPQMLRKEKLTGKKIRCELTNDLVVKSCTIITDEGQKRLWKVGER